MIATQRCPLCNRECPRDFLQKHHLQTRKKDRHDTELICRDCHATIHALFDNRQVAREVSSLEALLRHEAFARAVAFIRKQHPGSRVRVRTARNHRRRRR